MSYEVHMLAKDLKAGDVVVDYDLDRKDPDVFIIEDVSHENPWTGDKRTLAWVKGDKIPVRFDPNDRVTVRRG